MKNYEIFGKKYLFKTKNISRRIGNDLYFFLDDGIYEIRSKIALLNLVCTWADISFFSFNPNPRFMYFEFLKNFVSKKPLFIWMRVITSNHYISGRKTKNIDLDFFFKQNNLGIFKGAIGPSNKKNE